MFTDELMEKLTKAISHQYRDDQTSPSLIISSLKKGYYCSVVRYTESFAKGKQVICNAKSDNLNSALTELANKFLMTTAVVKDPVQELNDLVGRRKS